MKVLSAASASDSTRSVRQPSGSFSRMSWSATSFAFRRMPRERSTRMAMRLRFSMRTKRRIDGSAHNSPILRVSCSWKPSTIAVMLSRVTVLWVWAT